MYISEYCYDSRKLAFDSYSSTTLRPLSSDCPVSSIFNSCRQGLHLFTAFRRFQFCDRISAGNAVIGLLQTLGFVKSVERELREEFILRPQDMRNRHQRGLPPFLKSLQKKQRRLYQPNLSQHSQTHKNPLPSYGNRHAQCSLATHGENLVHGLSSRS
jgi:hypothetical protein